MLIGTVHNRNEYIHDVDVNIGYRRIQLHQPHQELDALLHISQFQKSGHFLIEKERALCRLDSTHNNIKNHTNRTPLWEPFATPSNSPRFLDFQISGLFSNVSISYYFLSISLPPQSTEPPRSVPPVASRTSPRFDSPRFYPATRPGPRVPPWKRGKRGRTRCTRLSPRELHVNGGNVDTGENVAVKKAREEKKAIRGDFRAAVREVLRERNG